MLSLFEPEISVSILYYRRSWMKNIREFSQLAILKRRKTSSDSATKYAFARDSSVQRVNDRWIFFRNACSSPSHRWINWLFIFNLTEILSIKIQKKENDRWFEMPEVMVKVKAPERFFDRCVRIRRTCSRNGSSSNNDHHGHSMKTILRISCLLAYL